ncbi:hypothetical protein ACH4SK_36595 [Streptomyces inhibens]|uniref:hypothetical protein n=1 Tax=Streptomyces inhibens TaxID=2293571 RepID=UPI0037AB3056
MPAAHGTHRQGGTRATAAVPAASTTHELLGMEEVNRRLAAQISALSAATGPES